MALFYDIKTGLSEAIEFERGNLKAKTTTLPYLLFADLRPKKSRLYGKVQG